MRKGKSPRREQIDDLTAKRAALMRAKEDKEVCYRSTLASLGCALTVMIKGHTYIM